MYIDHLIMIVCAYGVSNTAARGPVGNPYDKTRSSGGSSSGCGVLLAIGEADMAIGGDQGGSIRIVSHGMKRPTYACIDIRLLSPPPMSV